MNAQALTVPFHGTELFIVEHNGQPYTPMKPIVEGMGLDWAAQFTKIKQRFASTIAEITMVAEDGKKRVMTCLPLRKLAGWLYTISAGKVNPELRDKIVMYQNECDDALWDYWTKGQATRPHSRPDRTRKMLPGGLTLEQQDAIKALVKSRVEALPKERQGGAAITCWSSIKSKFKVKTYKEVPPEHFGEVLSLIARLPLEGEHIPASKPDPKPEPPPHLSHSHDYRRARERLAYLRGFAGSTFPGNSRDAFTDALDELERCLIAGWTEIDEAMLRFHLGMDMLRRWKGCR
jgi:hypothetical protein